MYSISTVIDNTPWLVTGSPTGELVGYGRLGFVKAWELRPIKPILYNLVASSSQLGFTQKRRTKLRDLYTLLVHYIEEKHKVLKKGPSYGSDLFNWDVLVKEYLLARQSYRDSLNGSVIGLPTGEYASRLV